MICSTPDCDSHAITKGQCKRCYQRAYMAERRAKAPQRRQCVEDRFLAAIAAGNSVRDACAAVGVSTGVVYGWSDDSPAFKAKWEAAKPKPIVTFVPTAPTREPAVPFMTEEDLMATVMERGKILTSMMRLPPSQWKPEWLEDL